MCIFIVFHAGGHIRSCEEIWMTMALKTEYKNNHGWLLCNEPRFYTFISLKGQSTPKSYFRFVDLNNCSFNSYSTSFKGISANTRCAKKKYAYYKQKEKIRKQIYTEKKYYYSIHTEHTDWTVLCEELTHRFTPVHLLDPERTLQLDNH